jgi:hypothetical protein
VPPERSARKPDTARSRRRRSAEADGGSSAAATAYEAGDARTGGRECEDGVACFGQARVLHHDGDVQVGRRRGVDAVDRAGREPQDGSGRQRVLLVAGSRQSLQDAGAALYDVALDRRGVQVGECHGESEDHADSGIATVTEKERSSLNQVSPCCVTQSRRCAARTTESWRSSTSKPRWTMEPLLGSWT